MLVLASWLCFPARSEAISLSLADGYFPSFGQARHWDQSNEYLGASGSVYDGVEFAIGSNAIDLTLRTTVGDLFGEGDYEWLSVWIDWDRSHTWGFDEQVVSIADQWFPFGTSERDLAIPIPQGAVLDETWMRVRFTFDGAHGPTGDLYTGEVEDYLLQSPAAPVPEPSALLLLGSALVTAAACRCLKRRIDHGA